jgi:hypothetical protein
VYVEVLYYYRTAAGLYYENLLRFRADSINTGMTGKKIFLPPSTAMDSDFAMHSSQFILIGRMGFLDVAAADFAKIYFSRSYEPMPSIRYRKC